MTDQNAIAEHQKSAQEECDRLRAENARLRAMLGIEDSVSKAPGPTAIPIVSVSDSSIAAPSTPEKKVSLFRSLFRGREDVYAIRWEGKGGKSGYSPAGVTDWRAIHAARPEERTKVARKTRTLQPLADSAIRDHLTGKQTVGVYPLLPDETCWFLAVDFDKKSWMADAAALASTCQRFQIPAAVERSRSGNGAHIWFFFDRPVLATNARQLGCALLTRTMENRHEIGLGSYDRLFPSQDTLPKGGFGNLIALPLQKRARDQGNSVFLDELFQPHPDQWKFLESVQRVPTDMLARMIQEIAPGGNTIGVHLSFPEEGRGPLWKTRIREDLIFLIERGVLIEYIDATLMDGEHRKSICAILRNAARYKTPPAKIFVEIKPILMRLLRKRSWMRTTNPSKLSDFIQ